MTVTIENTYTGNGSTTDYSFTFPYLDTPDIKASLAGINTTAFTLLNATTVRFNSAPGNGVAIRIYRETDFEAPKATFYPGSAIRASDLNDNALQNLYVNQESNDKVADAWLTGDPTIISTESWHTSDDTKIATTKAIEGRIDTKIDSALVDDIAAGSSIAITDNSPSSGKVTIGVIASTGSNSGSMSAADKTKLDGIESNATADQTNAEIRAAVEAASDSNVFTDADHSKLNGIEASATADQTAAEIRTLVESATDSNVFTDADHSKLNAIEASATADQTASEIKTLLQSDKITDSEIATGTLDNRYYTKTESDAAYFNVSTGDTIKDGDTFPDNDTTIATTAAINDRIIDLVDDVGGFVPIANETSFPNANPDVNNGAGTLVSIKALSSNVTSNGSGVATISNGTVGNSTVTINGLANSTTYAATFGMIVETTTTLNTYTFHRLVPKATEVTTVAGSISNVNTVAGSIANVNTVAGNNTNINTVAGINSNVTTVAGISSNVTSVAGNSTNINAVNSNSSNINTVAGAITNVNNVGGSIANVNTVATNISGVNDFADRYRVASSDPGSNNDTGDLVFNTTSNELRVYNGSAWQGGVTATGSLLPLSGGQMTGNLTFSGSQTVDGRDVSADGTKLDGIAASANNYTHPNHSGEVTSTGDGATVIADNVVDEANLKVSNSPTNGYALTAQSGNTGGLTWAEISASPGGSNTQLQYNNSGSFAGSANLTFDGTNLLLADEKELRIGGTDTLTLRTKTSWGHSYIESTEDLHILADPLYLGTAYGTTILSITSSSGGYASFYGNVQIYNQKDLNISGGDIYVSSPGVITGNGSGLTHLDLADATNTGTVPTARLGSGTASSSNFLRGDGSWATPAGGVSSDGSRNTVGGTLAGGNIASGAVDNTFFGHDAGGDVTTGDYNTMIGSEAGQQCTGDMNTLIGSHAGYIREGNHSGTMVGYQAGYNSNSNDTTLLGKKAGYNDDGTYNIYVGTECAESQGSGQSNIAIGYQALKYAWGGTRNGNNNIGIGKHCFQYMLTSGYENVCMGTETGAVMTTGNHNVTLGLKAGREITTGYSNVFLGRQAGQKNTTGYNNIAMGIYAYGTGSNNKTGYNNVVLGNSAGMSCSTAHNNILMGAESGDQLTTGNYNIAFGNRSGKSITTATNNIYMGEEAGYGAGTSNTSNNNVALGKKAGSNTTSGSTNILIGYSAGSSITTGSNNLLLGTEVGEPFESPSGTITTGSNIVVLGNNDITDLYCADTSISSSDKRDKTDVTDFTHGLKWVEQLKPVTYRWDKRSWYDDKTPDGSKKRARQHIGFLAQDVLAVEQADGFASKKDDMLVVNLNEDDTAYGLKYERLVPVLVNAVKELSAKVKALEAK